MVNDKNKLVLTAKLVDRKDNLFFYEIIGEEKWKKVFQEQKEKYVTINNSGETVYSVPWYYGKECTIYQNNYSKNLFLNINEHLKYASRSEYFNHDYWSTLAKKTGDNNWLTRIKKK